MTDKADKQRKVKRPERTPKAPERWGFVDPPVSPKGHETKRAAAVQLLLEWGLHKDISRDDMEDAKWEQERAVWAGQDVDAMAEQFLRDRRYQRDGERKAPGYPKIAATLEKIEGLASDLRKALRNIDEASLTELLERDAVAQWRAHFYDGSRVWYDVPESPLGNPFDLLDRLLALETAAHDAATRCRDRPRGNSVSYWGSDKRGNPKQALARHRQQLKALTGPLIQKWQPVLGVQVADWGVKKMKTKWGSCNPTARRVWLNLDLAKKSERCVEYVLVHELAHLLERTHNDRFVGIMEQHLPSWRQCREELNAAPLGNEDWDY